MIVKIISDLSGEMQFEMAEEKVVQLIGNACCYSSEFSCEPALYDEAVEAVKEYAEKDEPHIEQKQPRNRLERMFGDYKARIPVESATLPLQKTDDGYKGFLLCECLSCGKIRGFHSKYPVSDYVCECGSTLPLRNLRPAHIHCKQCGAGFKYMTNVKKLFFKYSCLNCGAQVDLKLNSRDTAYVTV